MSNVPSPRPAYIYATLGISLPKHSLEPSTITHASSQALLYVLICCVAESSFVRRKCQIDSIGAADTSLYGVTRGGQRISPRLSRPFTAGATTTCICPVILLPTTTSLRMQSTCALFVLKSWGHCLPCPRREPRYIPIKRSRQRCQSIPRSFEI